MPTVTRPDGQGETPMNSKHAREVARALALLGCTEVSVLNPAPKSFHVAARHGAKGSFYLVDVYDAQKLLLELSRIEAAR
jgi:hypothetical protein